MVQKILLTLVLGLHIVTVEGQAVFSIHKKEKRAKHYTFYTDLSRLENDRLEIILYPPALGQDTLRYYLPRMVPGIYGVMDFGKLVSDFRAWDKNGKELPVHRPDAHSWEIRNAKKLSKISYRVDDYWEQFDVQSHTGGFYRSAGSHFEKDRVFILNHNALFGYFEHYDHLPFTLHFRKPEGFYGAGSLTPLTLTATEDRFTAASYRELVDAPLLYAMPDTASVNVSGTQVKVAVYSTAGDTLAAYFAQKLSQQLYAQRDYLGGKLPVKEYSFLIYHCPASPELRMADALEHNRSSLYLLAAEDPHAASELLNYIAAHEFFHIVSPLHIHSEEISAYHFHRPKLSKHLWLYEGLTEYATLHMPVKQGLQDTAVFLSRIQEKIQQMQAYGDSLSLTELSVKAIERQDEYYNFYLKGAVAGMCLDLRLRELSGGLYGTQALLSRLSQKYGPDKPFKDEELFDVIADLTQREIRVFFSRYIEGREPLPLKELLERAGILYEPEKGHTLRWVSSPSPAQEQVRKIWLGR